MGTMNEDPNPGGPIHRIGRLIRRLNLRLRVRRRGGGGGAINSREVLMKDEELHPVVKLARRTVESYVRDGATPEPEKLTSEMREQAGVFVSLHKHGKLRGCIGTFEATRKNVAEEIVANAVSSATRDPRFDPVDESELDDLEYSVDVLSRPESVTDIGELDHKEYGVIVESGSRRGLLLPDLAGVDSAEEQIAICRLKAGIAPDEPVDLYRFRVTRFK